MTPAQSPAVVTESAPALAAIRARRSHSKVTPQAPTTAELQALIEPLASVADHATLRPWRFIELRGDAREALGFALAEAAAEARTTPLSPEAEFKSTAKFLSKAQRASLVLAIVVSPRTHPKAPLWEQEAAASGAAHLLGLALHEAGWGSIWRSGPHTRSAPVHRAHRLAPEEYLLGWLYIGGIPADEDRPKFRRALDLNRALTEL